MRVGCRCCCARKIRGVEGSAIKTIDEKALDQLLAVLPSLVSSDGQLAGKLQEMRFIISIRLAKSQYLAKRFAGLVMVRNWWQRVSTYMQAQPQVEALCGLVDSLLDDLHQELLVPFTEIFRELVLRNLATPSQIRKLWVVSVNQHPSIIEAYFAAWTSLVNGFTDNHRNWLFKAVREGTEFPGAALNFLKFIAPKATDKQKGVIFGVLLPFAADTAFPDTSMPLLVQTICAYLPKGADFCLRQCGAAVQMVINQSNGPLALRILLNSNGYIDSRHAGQFFTELIKVNFVAEEHLGLAMHCWRNLILKLGRSLHEKELLAIMTLLKPHIQRHPKVATFFGTLLGSDTSPPVLTDAMIGILFKWLLSQENLDEDIFGLISSLVDRHQEFTDELSRELQLLLFRAQNDDVRSLIASVYQAPSRRAVFFEMVLPHLDNPSVITAVNCLVHLIEDAVDKELLGIPPNRFVDDEDKITIKISGDLECEVKLWNRFDRSILIKKQAN
jgi:hypothetical protein